MRTNAICSLKTNQRRDPDDVFRRLSACHNVLFTGHRAFLTAEALISISETTLVTCSRSPTAKPVRTPSSDAFPFVLLREHIQIIPQSTFR